MSQDYVAMYRARWADDDDWRALSMPAQWLYDFLAQHPDRNEAGIVPFTVKRWARVARGLTVADLRRWLAELDDAGFVVVDEDTEEVLVRAYIRVGKVYTHIRLFRNACTAIRSVESERIRNALGQELARLPELAVPAPRPGNERNIAEAVEAQWWLDELVSTLCDTPPEPPGQDAAHPMAHPMADGMAHPIAHPYGVGAGTGAGAGTASVGGSCSSAENNSLESNARARKRLSAVPDSRHRPGRKDAS